MQDPLKYFRVEARDILEQLQSGLLELERGGAAAEVIQRLLRLAHTLKGAARVVRQPQIATLAHALEELLLPQRGLERLPTSAEMEALLGRVDAIGALVTALAPAPVVAQAPAEPAVGPITDKQSGGALVEDAALLATAPLEQVEALVDGTLELGYLLGNLRDALAELGDAQRLGAQLVARLDPRQVAELGGAAGSSARALAEELQLRLVKLERGALAGLERATRELGLVRDRVQQLRLVAVSSMFGRLERTLRDAAVAVGKQASFEAVGGEVRVDADVLTAVERALVQAVRNAVAHGIEPSVDRVRAGKATAGKVRLEVERVGARICFRCRDDGRGVDLGEVRREAERLGRLPAGSAEPTPERLVDLLLEGGLSTTRQVTQVSGRGVGLNLIREALTGVSGGVKLETSSGNGTTVVLSVPADMAALEGLLVEAGGDVHVLPLDVVVRAVRVLPGQLNRTADGETLTLEGQLLPFAELSRLLGRASSRVGRDVTSVVVVKSGRGPLALGVDRLLGNETVVARSLPEAATLDASVVGVSLDAEGNPRLLLDADGLAAALGRAPLPSAPSAPARRVVLVVDDSLTTRMLEQSILESAGFEVHLASSAEQGLEMAHAARYDLFLVDVEMPGMDGFGFVERIRADPKLAAIPAVLVTSRASPEDRRRGHAAGANGHIAKGEFDQIEFLSRIRELVG